MPTPSRGPVRRQPHRKPIALVALALAGSLTVTAALATPVVGNEAAPMAMPAEAPAQTTLAGAWRKALEANPGLQAAKHGAAASEGAVIQSNARPNPEIAFIQEDTRSDARTSTVQINQLIELGGKRDARIRVAESERAFANATVFETQTALRYQVVNNFNALLHAQLRRQYALKTHELATQTRDAAQKRVQAGKVPPLEATRAQVAQANAALEVQQAQALIGAAQQSLAALWGGRASDVGEASGDFTAIAEPPSADHIDTLLAQAPAMVLARHALDQSRAAADLERAKRVQDPTVSLGVKRAKEVGRNQIVLGVSIALPLFDHNAGNQLQAIRKVDQAEQKLQEQHLQLQTQVFVARQQLIGSNQHAALLQSQMIPAAQSAYDVALRGFTLGKFSFLDALDAQRTLIDSQRQLLDQLMASHRARAEIDRLLGTPSMSPATTGN